MEQPSIHFSVHPMHHAPPTIGLTIGQFPTQGAPLRCP